MIMQRMASTEDQKASRVGYTEATHSVKTSVVVTVFRRMMIDR